MRRQQEELLRGYLQETVDEKASAMATTASPPGNEKAPGGGAYQAILRQRMSLPVYKMRQEILDAVHANQTIVISGKDTAFQIHGRLLLYEIHACA
jgi:HrpA-like RNA helicase